MTVPAVATFPRKASAGAGRCAVILTIVSTCGVEYPVRTEVYGPYRSFRTAEKHCRDAEELGLELLRAAPRDSQMDLSVRARVVPCQYPALEMLLDAVRTDLENGSR